MNALLKPARALCCAAALAAAPLHAIDLPDLGEGARQFLSAQQEALLGRSILRDIYAHPRYLDDAEIETYINALGYRLVAVSTGNQRDFNFFVVEEPTVNAFALPGGHIGIHTGLLLAAQSESELAGVVAHEIAHVTQDHIARMVAMQSQSTLPTMAALALALLAARNNANVASAAIASTQALSIQNQLNFSRDFEREADRLGFDMLVRAGFDPAGMSGFFSRLQRANRFYDSSAPAYLRTHPLTTERIADMEARSSSMPIQQVPDSTEFHLVRARIRALDGTPQDAVATARAAKRDGRYSNAVAARYQLTLALMRARQFDEAEREAARMLAEAPRVPMVHSLAAEVALRSGQTARALARYEEATRLFPGYRPLQYGLAETLLAARRAPDAGRLLDTQLGFYPTDRRLWRLAARAQAAQNRQLAAHRAQAEAAALSGNFVAAVEQIEIGIRAGDGSFHELSVAEARRREWQTQVEAQRNARI